MAEQVMAKEIGSENLAKRRLIILAIFVSSIGGPGAFLSSSRLAGGA